VERAAERPCRGERCRDRPQLVGSQRAAHPEASERCGDVRHLVDRERLAVSPQACRFLGLAEVREDLVARLTERELAGRLAPHRPAASIGERLQHPRPFQVSAGLPAARVGEIDRHDARHDARGLADVSGLVDLRRPCGQPGQAGRRTPASVGAAIVDGSRISSASNAMPIEMALHGVPAVLETCPLVGSRMMSCAL